MSDPLFRLRTTIAAVCPIVGLSITGPTSARIDFAPTATQPQKDSANAALAAFDWSQAAQDAWELAQRRAAAKAGVDNSATAPASADDELRIARAIAAVLLDEVNALRQWIESFKAATAAATSLANLQTRVAALAAMPDRTAAQARTAINSKIDGDA